MMSAPMTLPAAANGTGSPPGFYAINGNSQHAMERVTLSYNVLPNGIHEQSVDYANDYMMVKDDAVERELQVQARLSSLNADREEYRQEDENGRYLGETHVQDEDVEHLNEYGEYAADGEDGPVKLFVGQVPKSMDEDALFPIFSQFGQVERVSIIRDRELGHHRGCAFVTFANKADAEECERAFHDNYVLPDGKRPVQIRPASSGGHDSDNKIFVGMLPRDLTESDVRAIFEPYGEIAGIFMVRRPDPLKKSCAFVKYHHRASAQEAIDAVNNVTFEGFDRPLIVKFADAHKKGAKQSYRNMAPMHPHHTHSVPASVVSHGSHSSSPMGSPYVITDRHGTPLHLFPGHATPPPMALSPQIHSSGRPTQYGTVTQYPASYASSHGSLTPPPILTPYGYPLSHPFNQGNVVYSQQTVISPNSTRPQTLHPLVNLPPSDTAGGPKPLEGPAGANLFIYHLPHDLTDADLATAFNPFGNVLSAKVYVDKNTGESKGFGFVSYDSVISAENAIEQMNGFQIGNKRLKVQHKRVHHRPPLSISSGNTYAYYASSPILGATMADIPTSMEHYTLSDDGGMHGAENWI